jgi:hypothetical protein
MSKGPGRHATGVMPLVSRHYRRFLHARRFLFARGDPRDGRRRCAPRSCCGASATLSVMTLWAAPPRFLIPSEATRHHPNPGETAISSSRAKANPPSRHPNRSETRHLVIPTEAKRKWGICSSPGSPRKNCGMVMPRLNDTDERSSELCRRHSRNGNTCRDLCLFRTRAPV